MRACLVGMVLVGCVGDDAIDEPERAAGDAALYRVDDGESLSVIADKLGVEGGWHALQRALGKRTVDLRAGEGLAIPLALLPAGVDPYVDLGLAHYEPALATEMFVPCRTLEQRGGECLELGSTTACAETTPPRMPGPEDPDRDDCVYAADDSFDCPGRPGRQLVLYRDGRAAHTLYLPGQGHAWDDLELDGHLVDLDNDRADDLVIAAKLQRSSRGGYQTWRVFVVDGRSDTVTQLDVSQWGDGSLVASDRATCDLLVTSWEDSFGGPDLDPLDPPGVYLVGRRYVLEHGTVLPIGERSVRRLRDYFHTSEDDDVRATPAEWLSGPETSRWRELAPVRDYHPGTLIAAEARPTGLVLDIALADGNTLHVDAAGYGAATMRLLGWAATSSPLPDMYVPSNLPSWIGAQVLVDRATPVEDGDFDLGREVWIVR